jgi:hypothetical protein
MNKVYLPTLIAVCSAILIAILLFSAPVIILRPMQTTDLVVMIEPRDFGFNPQTAVTNHFMHPATEDVGIVRKKVHTEFHNMVKALHDNAIRVMVLQQPSHLTLPDAVFPNNWFSTFKDHFSQMNLVLYPMLDPSRQAEINPKLLETNLKYQGIEVHKFWNFTYFTPFHKALEGTGSIVFDHTEREAYVSLSSRSHREVAETVLHKINYHPIFFQSTDRGVPIYHTNLVLSIGKHFAVLCSECIADKEERNRVISTLESSNKEVIDISIEQMRKMCGNILELRNTNREPRILLSSTAYSAYTESQKAIFKKYGDFIVVDIPTIEQIGGGSARCLVAEIFH